jgi:outer membrane biosynthesis protein TonB
MRTMSSRSRLTAGVGTVAAAIALAGCGGATVDGEAPEVSSQPTTSATSTTPFAEERPEKPTGPVPPPPPQSPEPEPMPGEPEPLPPPEPEPGAEPAPGEGTRGNAEPAPGAGDFAALLERRGVALPDGMDPVATATEACGRFDGGQQMDEVSGWLGEAAGLDTDGQGFFLGAAVGTYCPQNFPKLG